MKVWLLKTAAAWDRFPELFKTLPREKAGLYLIILEEGVTRCPRCEPHLFPYFRQFVLDGGRIFICQKSLARFGIPETRPPDFLERVPEGWQTLKEFEAQGAQVEELE